MFRHIVHLHIPAFEIEVARVCRAELRGRPVAVAPPRSERAVILSASPEARREGVFKGMPLGKARKRCPALAVLPPDPMLTARASRSLLEVAAQYTPIWEPARPGHVYLDLTGTERLWGRAKDAGRRLGREVQARLSLRGAVGVAGNKMVSSIASKILVSEGVLDVDHGREASFMAPLPVEVVPGVGRARRQVLLEELNITRVRQLAVLDMGCLRLIFGLQAHLIRQRALGIDPRPVHPAPARPVVEEEITLPRDENDDQRLLGALYGLVERCARRMRTRGLAPRRAALLVRYSDQVESRRRIGVHHPSFWDFELYRLIEQLFFKACNRRVRVRFLRVRFWDFAESPQLPLFETQRPDSERRSRVIRALDRIRERYGEDAIGYGRTI